MLLVEDNDDDVLLMKLALKHAGIQNPLYIVEDGQQAIDYLASQMKLTDRERNPMPGAVFLDLKLPVRSGYEVLTWIRQQERLAETAVVILTSSNREDDLRSTDQQGADSYVIKPPTAQQLLALAKKCQWLWLELNEAAHAELFHS